MIDRASSETEGRRAGFVALIGAPNAGKSTLLNALVGSKISIVTRKAQTTRARVVGIAIEGQTQLAFVDTPGIFSPKRRLDRAMISAAWRGAAEADAILLLVDAARGLDEDTRRIVENLKAEKRRALLALNKIDAIERTRLLKLAHELNALFPFDETFMISALTGDGVADLKRALAERLPKGPWLYPEDQLADMPERLLAAEVTREKLFERLHQELPYSLTVETESWKAAKGGGVRIEQVIYVQKPGHKGIVLGKGGATVKEIGSEARKELEAIFDRRVHLFLFIKVREKWMNDPARYREMGLDFTD